MMTPEKREEWIIRQARERPAAERAVFLDGASLEAFAVLREGLGGGGLGTPARIRRDPFCSRLKDDPRFEEILKSAKPLGAPISNSANEEPGK